MSSTVVTNRLKYCFRCSELDIEQFLDSSIENGSEGLHVASLGKPGSQTFEVTCPSCKLLLSVAPRYKRKHCLELRLFDRLPNEEASSANLNVRFVAVVRQNKRLKHDGRTAHEIGSRGLLIPRSKDKTQASTVTIVDSKTIPYSFLRSQIHECVNFHSDTCRPRVDVSDTKNLRVIDCWNGEIVAHKKAAPYLALSYVWGPAPDPIRLKNLKGAPTEVAESCVSEDAPLTVRDAMVVVRELGYRYLWVDRYCVPQNAGHERHEAIANMNEVYAHAVATIVALHGNGSDEGLPGVTTTRRSIVQQAEYNTGSLTSTLPHLVSLIQESAWATRGWTYQEARLSPLCIFFSGFQVYVTCQKSACSEALSETTILHSPARRQLAASSLRNNILSRNDKVLRRGLLLDRFTYSQRTLTFQSDALDAFRGILRIHSFITTWGIPVSHNLHPSSPCVAFAMGLLWTRYPDWAVDRHLRDQNVSQYARRPGFPTWSWLSVIGHIYQDLHKTRGTAYESFITQSTQLKSAKQSLIASGLKVELQTALDRFEPLEEIVEKVRRDQLSNILPEVAKSIVIEADIVKVCRVESRSGAQNNVFYICDEEGHPVKSDGTSSSRFELEYDVDDESRSPEEEKDALVLVNWIDGETKTNVRLILMLLRWVDEGIAERVGLMGEYHITRRKSYVDSLVKTRRRFQLR